jgi:hypothetical protein
MAHEPVPNPQSRIFFGSGMGGKISRPSKALLSILCWLFNLSASSYDHLRSISGFTLSIMHKRLGAIHFINRSEIYEVLKSVPLKLTVVDCHRTQKATIERYRAIRIRIAIVIVSVSLPQSTIG